MAQEIFIQLDTLVLPQTLTQVLGITIWYPLDQMIFLSQNLTHLAILFGLNN